MMGKKSKGIRNLSRDFGEGDKREASTGRSDEEELTLSKKRKQKTYLGGKRKAKGSIITSGLTGGKGRSRKNGTHGKIKKNRA